MAHTSWAPWKVLLKWAPFHIDALGLVTLLGAEEVNAAVGRLVSSAYLEYLPLLGAYVIAGNRFTEKAAGFNLYNISQGIHTTDLAAWLTRWMLSQEFANTCNFVEWTVTAPKSRKNEISVSLIISFVLNGFLVAGTILSKDWYGFANAMAMIVSIIVRAYIIGQQRIAFDSMIDKAVNKSKSAKGANNKGPSTQDEDDKKPDVRNRTTASAPHGARSVGSDSSSATNRQKQAISNASPTRPKPEDSDKDVWTGTTTKVLIIQSDSKAVTFWMPNELLVEVFIRGPEIQNPKTYLLMRSIGWLAFAVHIVAIGMADLASQMYTVVLMVLPTLLLIAKVGCDDSEWLSNFEVWVRRKLRGEDRKPDQDAEKSEKPREFRTLRQCWIGSRLKAEICEWPESYEFHQVGEGDDKKWVSGERTEGQERSKKRQDLYAWLGLTTDEEESMDKWDLFPHIRKGDNEWWQTYKLKKGELKDKRASKGPQQPPDTTPLPPPGQHPAAGPTTPQGPADQQPRMLQAAGRTRTQHFIGAPASEQASRQTKSEPRQGTLVTISSSAFPAISDHDQIKADEGGAKTDDAETQTLDDSDAPTGLPPDNAPPPSTAPPGHDATVVTSLNVLTSSEALTQSPTTDVPPHDQKHN
ncbi:hypothetical protein CLAIMM_13499 [Cladophialophora immunda]|nr:hypothetical protein CLAIMM_13499 [Cladophialophora immunda]